VTSTTPIDFVPPYPAGWFDRLVDWIGRAPGPNVAWLAGLALLETIYITALCWSEGTLPVGTIEPRRLFVVVVAPYLLGTRFYLDRVAHAALDDFRPALSVDEAEFQRLRWELTTLPRRTTLAATALAVVVFAVNWPQLPDWVLEQYARSHGTALVAMAPIGLCTLTVGVLSVAEAIHQLQMVQRIHARATTIHLFRTKPLYAFSRVAAQTGMSLLLLTYSVAAVRPDVLQVSPPLKTLVLVMVATAVGCFILPLRGMHRRIAAEKDRALARTALRFEMLTGRLHERYEAGDVADTDKLAMQLAGVMTERDALARVPTWPWEGTTMTGFVTTMVLPVIVWVLQRVLTRLGF
jgi:hypothetical protein